MERIGNMKRQVRRGAFETNSSSMHAINVFRRTKNRWSDIPDYVIVHQGEFGWECETYNDWEDKLAYLYTACVSRCHHWVKDEITGQYEDKFDYKQLKDYQYRIKAALEELGVNDVIFADKDEDDGYIDHSNELGEHDFIDEILENWFEDFIFNSASYIETGNDNSEECVVSENSSADWSYYKSN